MYILILLLYTQLNGNICTKGLIVEVWIFTIIDSLHLV